MPMLGTYAALQITLLNIKLLNRTEYPSFLFCILFGLNNILFQFVETFIFKYIDRIQRHNHTGFENKHIMLL